MWEFVSAWRILRVAAIGFITATYSSRNDSFAVLNLKFKKWVEQSTDKSRDTNVLVLLQRLYNFLCLDVHNHKEKLQKHNTSIKWHDVSEINEQKRHVYVLNTYNSLILKALFWTWNGYFSGLPLLSPIWSGKATPLPWMWNSIVSGWDGWVANHTHSPRLLLPDLTSPTCSINAVRLANVEWKRRLKVLLSPFSSLSDVATRPSPFFMVVAAGIPWSGCMNMGIRLVNYWPIGYVKYLHLSWSLELKLVQG